MNRFDGQVVIVSGASRGIGKAIAIAFAAEGARVACLATKPENAADTVEAIVKAGGEAVAVGCNVGRAESVEQAFAFVTEHLGVPSVLVNNAGVTRDTLLMRMSEDDWDQVIQTNLKGAFLTTRAASKAMMKARYGRIVNISSVIGLHGAAGQANYAASKAGLIGLTLSVAKELGARNITCNAVAPGFIETDMTKDLPEAFRDQVSKTAPIGRLGTADDVVPAVLFLASKESAYITGQTISVDGGLML